MKLKAMCYSIFDYRNMFSMFDKCARNQEESTNLEQLACTEIRIANLGNCNYMNYAKMGMSGETNPLQFKNKVIKKSL